MSVRDFAEIMVGRARYAAAQGLRSTWYGAHYYSARRRASDFNRPGDTPFQPERGLPARGAMRRAFLDAFVEDRRNIEDGLYPSPRDVRLRDFLRALSSSQAFMRDVPKVDARRMARNGVEVRTKSDIKLDRFPVYYRQNFHYQSDGWFSDESARLYDTQVETLFGGSADAMRRAALAEIGRELRGRDQRKITLLDVAAGTGRFLAQVMAAYPKLRAGALELSPHYAKAIRKAVHLWPQVDVFEGAAEAMPVDDESQDIVVAVYLFHELPPKVRPVVFAEMTRVLKPGGLFVFADSLQFGDNPELDGVLEFFPEGFHEPYYKGYLSADLDTEMGNAGLQRESSKTAFLTKIATYRKGSEAQSA